MSLGKIGVLTRVVGGWSRSRGAVLAIIAGSLVPLAAAQAQLGADDGASVIEPAYQASVLGDPVESFSSEPVSYLGAWDTGGSSFSLSFESFSPSYCAPTWCEPAYCAPVYSYCPPSYTTYYPPVYSYSYSYWRPTYYAGYWSPPAYTYGYASCAPGYSYSSCAPVYSYACGPSYWRPYYAPSYSYSSGLSLSFVFGDFDRCDDWGWSRSRWGHGGRDWNRGNWNDHGDHDGGRDFIRKSSDRRSASFAAMGPNLPGIGGGSGNGSHGSNGPHGAGGSGGSPRVIHGQHQTIGVKPSAAPIVRDLGGVRPGMPESPRGLGGVRPQMADGPRDLGGVRPQMPAGPRGLVGVTPKIDTQTGSGPTFVVTPPPNSTGSPRGAAMGPTFDGKPSSQPKVIRSSNGSSPRNDRPIAMAGGSLQSAPSASPMPMPVRSVKPNYDEIRSPKSPVMASTTELAATPTPKVRTNSKPQVYSPPVVSAPIVPSAPAPKVVRSERMNGGGMNVGAPVVQPRMQPRPGVVQSQPPQQSSQPPRQVRSAPAPQQATMGPTPSQDQRSSGGRSSGGGGGGGGKPIRKKN